MSGCRSRSHAARFSTRCLMEFTFQVAIRMGGPGSVLAHHAEKCAWQKGLPCGSLLRRNRARGDNYSGSGVDKLRVKFRDGRGCRWDDDSTEGEPVHHGARPENLVSKKLLV